MIRVQKKTRRSSPAAALARELSRLRQEMDDLRDYLDLLEARARNAGKPRFSIAQVKAELGL